MSVQRHRSFHHLEMEVFSSWEQKEGIPQNLTIFYQRSKTPDVVDFSLTQLISVIVFVFIIIFSL